MTDPSSALKLTGPFAVHVSSVVALRFNIANASFSPVTWRSGTLLVPVNTGGTNLTSGAMTPVTHTPGWTFASEITPRTGYAAFKLLASGDGTIPVSGSVAFELSNVTVAGVTGTAILPFAAETSLGRWETDVHTALIAPSTVPNIQDAGLLPLTILQNQETVLSWTATGASYCEVTDIDDQKVLAPHPPASGALATLDDTPVQGNSSTKTAANGGKYYIRRYLLTAHSAGRDDPDERRLYVTVGLPTIVGFTLTPQELKLDEHVVVSWSVANLDPKHGRITLTVAPQDGTAAQQIAIPLGSPDDNGLFGGTATVTPTPLAKTHYTLTIDNGFGATATSTKTVKSSLPAGINPMASLGPFAWSPPNLWSMQPLASFDDKLWCAGDVVYWTRDGTEWTPASQSPKMDCISALLVADLGHGGEVLCAFGFHVFPDNDSWSYAPLAAWTRDGAAWHAMAPPPLPMMGALAAAPGILLFGGYVGFGFDPQPGVFSSQSGSAWTQIGNSFPAAEFGIYPVNVARFDGKLYTVPPRWNNGNGGVATAQSSADGGKTWQAQGQPTPQLVGMNCALQVAGDELWLLGAGGADVLGAAVLALKPGGSWTSAGWTLTEDVIKGGNGVWLTTTIHRGHLWFMSSISDPATFGGQLFFLNRVLPGTVFKLVPPGGGGNEADSAPPDPGAQPP